MARTVNLEPTADGYEAIARRFLVSCAEDATDDRRASTLHVLGGLVELAGYLARLPDGAVRIERLKLHAAALAVRVAPREPAAVEECAASCASRVPFGECTCGRVDRQLAEDGEVR